MTANGRVRMEVTININRVEEELINGEWTYLDHDIAAEEVLMEAVVGEYNADNTFIATDEHQANEERLQAYADEVYKARPPATGS